MIRFILADLRRLWAASLVIVALIALATTLGVTVTLQERALRLGSARAADKFDLIIGAPGSETQLVLSSVFLQPAPLTLIPGEVLQKLAADPRVAWAAPIGFGDGFAGYPIVGTTTALITGTTTGFTAGRMFAAEGEAVVGSNVDLAIGADIHPMHGDAGGGGHVHNALTYRTVGRLAATGTAWDRAILVPIQAVWHLHGMGGAEIHDDDHDGDEADQHTPQSSAPDGGATSAGPVGVSTGEHHQHGHIDPAAPLDEAWHGAIPGLPAILVKPKAFSAAYKLRQEYRNKETFAVFPAEVLTRLYATLGDARTVLLYIAYGAEALVAMALLLITIIHVGQRRRQIGALRAFGAPRHAVFGIVWSELFVLIACGIGLGFAGGFAVATALAHAFALQSGVGLPVGFTGDDVRTALVLLGLGALLAALPGAIAYRQSPAAALRG